MRQLTTLLLLLITCSLTAQVEVNNGWWGRNGDRVRGNGDLVTKSRDVDGFTGVKACCSMTVEVAEGPFSVRVEAESNLQEFVKTEVSGRTLEIGYVSEANFKSTKPINVYVTLPRLEKLAASSSSRLVGTTPFSGDELELDVNSSATLIVDFSGEEVDVDASSSGDIQLSGSADKLTVDASSSSRVEGRDFRARRAYVDVNSSGSIQLEVTETLRAEASSSGSVSYTGSPRDVTADSSSGGSVRKRN